MINSGDILFVFIHFFHMIKEQACIYFNAHKMPWDIELELMHFLERSRTYKHKRKLFLLKPYQYIRRDAHIIDESDGISKNFFEMLELCLDAIGSENFFYKFIRYFDF